DPTGDKQMNVAANSTQERAERKYTDGRSEYATGAEAVRHPAADGYEDGKAQGIAGQYGLHAERRNMQSGRNSGYGGVENCGVQRLHEERHRNQPRKRALARVRGGRGNKGSR